jgi:hypothetical protein
VVVLSISAPARSAFTYFQHLSYLELPRARPEPARIEAFVAHLPLNDWNVRSSRAAPLNRPSRAWSDSHQLVTARPIYVVPVIGGPERLRRDFASNQLESENPDKPSGAGSIETARAPPGMFHFVMKSVMNRS